MESSGSPFMPNPILESQLTQSFLLFPRIPILAFEGLLVPLQTALNPSLLQLRCKEPWGPISIFQRSRPRSLARNAPSEMRACREVAVWLRGTNLVWLPIFIPRQILEKFVLQYVGSLVSWLSNPVIPPAMLYVFLSLQSGEEKRKVLCKANCIVMFLDFHSTKQGLPLVDSWSSGLD